MCCCALALQQRNCCSVRTTVIPLWPVDYLQRNGRVCEARQCIIFFGLPRRGVRTNPLEPPLPTGLGFLKSYQCHTTPLLGFMRSWSKQPKHFMINSIKIAKGFLKSYQKPYYCFATPNAFPIVTFLSSSAVCLQLGLTITRV